MTILVFGKSGQVAQSLAEREGAAPAPLAFLGRDQADLSRPEQCAAAIFERRPCAVINAAAWTAVDAAEDSESEAKIVNGDSPGVMAATCAELAIPFLHASSDYVFDGSGALPWRPDSPLAPLGAYGRSKALGERRVRESGARAAILRTSWVFSPFGSNFVKTMLRLGSERKTLSVVDDQIGGPTSAQSLAGALLAMAAQMLAGKAGGTYHFSGRPTVSWAVFANAIMTQANLACEIIPIPSSAYPTPTPRPLNSRLDCGSIFADFGVSQSDWRTDLIDVIEQLRMESILDT
ncbi:MAG: dTDP-4-dehydrorhamnose reductase [Aquiluna sp.]